MFFKANKPSYYFIHGLTLVVKTTAYIFYSNTFKTQLQFYKTQALK